MTIVLGTVIVALLIVTGLGIVGMASFWVTRRTKQIGTRRALGAQRFDIRRYFMIENLIVVGIGIGIGLVLTYGFNLWLMQHYELPRLSWYYVPLGRAGGAAAGTGGGVRPGHPRHAGVAGGGDAHRLAIARSLRPDRPATARALLR